MSTSTMPAPTRTPPTRPATGWLRRLWRGREADPGWVRPALLALLAGTAVLYLWGLGASGYANDFYAAAVQAGTRSWKALFFGSLDSSNFITVDKPPASLWLMGLSGRIFGFSTWSMLAPQALAGVASVGLLYATVRRWSGPVAGLAAGAVLALTPAAVLMFRFNNPDALLVLLLVAAGYAVVRATERASVGWLLVAGTAIGLGFLTKMLQAFLILPALVVTYLVAAPTSLRRRLLHLLAGGAAVLVSAGWWVAIVELWPAGSRPYIGGSTNNSVLQLALGYNGLGRLTGNTAGGGAGPGGGPGGGTAGGAFGGPTGLGRLFASEMGAEISWLLPAALVALVALAWLTRRAPRTDQTRAALLLWGGWLLVTGAVFSFMAGISHPYYTVALAPAIGALVATGAGALWRERGGRSGRIGLALLVAVTAGWSYRLLAGTPGWLPWLRYLIVALGVLGVVALLIQRARWRQVATVGALAGTLAVGAGSAAYATATAGTPHGGSIPSAGPAGYAQSAVPGGRTDGRATAPGGVAGRPNGGAFPGGPPAGAGAGAAGSGAPGAGAAGGAGDGAGPGSVTGPLGGPPTGSGQAAGAGEAGAATVDSALVAMLRGAGTSWAAATVGSQSAAPLELATGTAVLAIGGFSGSDNTPTLAQFQRYVSQGRVRYFVGSGGFGGGGRGGSGTGAAISQWVQQHYTATSVGGQLVYDLNAPTS